jgi:hypothetical protein
MRSESGQKETPAPVTVAKGGRGSSGVHVRKCAATMPPRQTRYHLGPLLQPSICLPSSSANGAPHLSPGQRPGYAFPCHQALKGRHNRYFAPWRLKKEGWMTLPKHRQKETPGPLNRKRSRKGSRGQHAQCAATVPPRQTQISYTKEEDSP